MEFLDHLQPYLLVVLGFLAGLLGPIIVDRNKRRLDTEETYRALVAELANLRYRLAVTAFDLLFDGGKIRHDDLKLLYRAVRAHEEGYQGANIPVAMEKMLAGTDQQLSAASYVRARQRQQNNVGKSLKKISAPLLDAKLAQLVGLAPAILNALLEVKAQIAILNEEVDQQRLYFNLTFSAKSENLITAASMCTTSETNVGNRARILVEKISVIPDLKLPEFDLPNPEPAAAQ